MSSDACASALAVAFFNSFRRLAICPRDFSRSSLSRDASECSYIKAMSWCRTNLSFTYCGVVFHRVSICIENAEKLVFPRFILLGDIYGIEVDTFQLRVLGRGSPGRNRGGKVVDSGLDILSLMPVNGCIIIPCQCACVHCV